MSEEIIEKGAKIALNQNNLWVMNCWKNSSRQNYRNVKKRRHGKKGEKVKKPEVVDWKIPSKQLDVYLRHLFGVSNNLSRIAVVKQNSIERRVPSEPELADFNEL